MAKMLIRGEERCGWGLATVRQEGWADSVVQSKIFIFLPASLSLPPLRQKKKRTKSVPRTPRPWHCLVEETLQHEVGEFRRGTAFLADPDPDLTPESTPLDYLPSERANNSTSWEDREREPALQH